MPLYLLDMEEKNYYKCELCEKKYARFYRLKMHHKCVHEKSCPVYTCNQCERVFSHADNMKHHQDSVHNHSKYICQMCGNQYGRKVTLQKFISW